MLMCVVYLFVYFRAEEDPADWPGESGENPEGDWKFSLRKNHWYAHVDSTLKSLSYFKPFQLIFLEERKLYFLKQWILSVCSMCTYTNGLDVRAAVVKVLLSGKQTCLKLFHLWYWLVGSPRLITLYKFKNLGPGPFGGWVKCLQQPKASPVATDTCSITMTLDDSESPQTPVWAAALIHVDLQYRVVVHCHLPHTCCVTHTHTFTVVVRGLFGIMHFLNTQSNLNCHDQMLNPQHLPFSNPKFLNFFFCTLVSWKKLLTLVEFN